MCVYVEYELNTCVSWVARRFWSGVIFGSIGVGFFIYGKRLPAITPLYVGVARYDFPYFIANVYVLVGVGVVLSDSVFCTRVRRTTYLCSPRVPLLVL